MRPGERGPHNTEPSFQGIPCHQGLFMSQSPYLFSFTWYSEAPRGLRAQDLPWGSHLQSRLRTSLGVGSAWSPSYPAAPTRHWLGAPIARVLSFTAPHLGESRSVTQI